MQKPSSLLNFIVNFWQLDDTYNFTPNEQALFMLILKLANAGRWSSLVVPLDNGTVMLKMRIGKVALEASQIRLQEAGLITFVPGNGRGKVGTYTINPPVKGAIPAHLYGTLSPEKGAVSDHLSAVKGGVKVGQDDTLYSPEPASSAASGAPKIIDTIVSTDVLTGSAEKPAPVKKVSKAKKQPTGLFTLCIDEYNEWFKAQSDGMGAKIDGAQGNAMKSIIAYLASQVKAKAVADNKELSPEDTDAKILQSWKYILQNTHLLTQWLQGQTRLIDFNSNLQNILIRVRHELRNQQNPSAATAPGTSRKGGGSVAGLQGLKRNGGANPAE